MLRKWKCTNPNCEMNRKGLILMSDQPAYAQIRCEMCGAPMTSIAGDSKVIFVGDYPNTVLSSGAMQITRSQKGLFARMVGDKSEAIIADMDIAIYPEIQNIRDNPQLLRPDLFSYLQTTDLFLTRDNDNPKTIAVVRCPSHHLSIPLSQSPQVGIHVEAHSIGGWFIFGIYPLVWDNPRVPWYAEQTICPYDMIGANEEELACPRVHGYSWRKLFYLLTQENTELIFIDENHKVAALRSTSLRPGQAAEFAKLVNILESCSGKQITKPDFFKVHSLYNQTVNIEEIQARFPRQ